MKVERIQGIFHLFLIYLFSMIFLWIGITYVSQNIRYSSAQRYFSAVTAAVEQSYFSERVIDRCVQDAGKKGYHLSVQRYAGADRADAKISLEYVFVIPVLQKEQRYRIEGYAR